MFRKREAGRPPPLPNPVAEKQKSVPRGPSRPILNYLSRPQRRTRHLERSSRMRQELARKPSSSRFIWALVKAGVNPQATQKGSLDAREPAPRFLEEPAPGIPGWMFDTFAKIRQGCKNQFHHATWRWSFSWRTSSGPVHAGVARSLRTNAAACRSSTRPPTRSTARPLRCHEVGEPPTRRLWAGVRWPEVTTSPGKARSNRCRWRAVCGVSPQRRARPRGAGAMTPRVPRPPAELR